MVRPQRRLAGPYGGFSRYHQGMSDLRDPQAASGDDPGLVVCGLRAGPHEPGDSSGWEGGMTEPGAFDQPRASLDEVLCTEELLRRPTRPPDHAAENRALAALA